MIRNINKLTIAFIIIVVSSCGTADDESIKNEIKEKKEQISTLEREILALEDSLGNEILSDRTAGKVLVRIKEIDFERYYHYVEVTGSVEAIQDAFISTETGGQIRNIHVEEGQKVTKGQLLIRLNTTVLENGIEEVKTGLELAETVYKKQKELWDQEIGSEIQYLQAKNRKESLENKLKTLKAQMEMSNIRAPFNGVVDEIFRKEGEMAVPGMRIMQLVNLSRLYINSDVSEAYLPKIRKGDTVLVRFPSYPGIVKKVPVYRTGNVIHPDNRTFNVQLRINNIDEKLKPNLISVLKINDYKNDSAFVVPSIIVKEELATGNEKRSFIFVSNMSNGRNIAEKVYVKTGVSYKDRTEIVKGLKKGAKVIVEGYNLVTNGTEIGIVD